MHVPLQKGSRWAKSSQTEFYDDLAGIPLDADMVRRARGEEMKYLVDSLNVWSLSSSAVSVGDMSGAKAIRHQQRTPHFSRVPVAGGRCLKSSGRQKDIKTRQQCVRRRRGHDVSGNQSSTSAH